MTTKARNRIKRAEVEARIRETFERWRLANTRAERQAKLELIDLAGQLLTARGQLSVEELIDAHRAKSGLGIKVAVAEVEEYHRDVTQKLRDRGMLIYPVTEIGFVANVPPKAHQVSYHVPGMGRGQSTYGWRVAKVANDPVFIAYWDMRLAQAAGGVKKITNMMPTAIAAGVLTTPLPAVNMPTTVAAIPASTPKKPAVAGRKP